MSSDVSTYAKRTGARMRAVRTARGLALHEIQEASAGRFKAAAVGSWERGDRVISVEKLTEYAGWLGVDITRLLPAAEGSAEWRMSIADKAAVRAAGEVALLLQCRTSEAAALVAASLAELTAAGQESAAA